MILKTDKRQIFSPLFNKHFLLRTEYFLLTIFSEFQLYAEPAMLDSEDEEIKDIYFYKLCRVN